MSLGLNFMNDLVREDKLIEAKVVIWESVVAAIATLAIVLGGAYALIIPEIHQDLRDLEFKQHEEEIQMKIRIKALEISDARTGVHLVNLTDSIEKLIVKLDP